MRWPRCLRATETGFRTDQDFIASPVCRGRKASGPGEPECHNDPQRPDVERGDRDPECGRGELLAAEIKAGLDGLSAQALAGQVRTQAAAGIERGRVVPAAWHLAVRAERAEADQFAVLDQCGIAASETNQERRVSVGHVVAVVRGRIAPGHDVSDVGRCHRDNPHAAIKVWRRFRGRVNSRAAPSAWAYRLAGDLFPAVEIPLVRQPVRLDSAELDQIGRFPVLPGVSLDEYIADAPVGGMVVALSGRIVYERYPRMRPDERHLLMSVTKVFASALIGILELRGLLDLDQSVEAVIGELADSAWAQARVRDVLGMASGIGYRLPGSGRARCLHRSRPPVLPVRGQSRLAARWCRPGTVPA